MICCRPRFNINKLAILSALLVVFGDIIAYIITVQAYYDSLDDKTGKTAQQPEIPYIVRQRFL